MSELMHIEANIEEIEAQIERANALAQHLKDTARDLAAAGMYDGIPHLQWQTRKNGQSKYLYLIFRQDDSGRYEGPDGKRKVYIGCDEAKIAEAKQMIANRGRYDHLLNVIREISRLITNYRYKVDGLRLQARDAAAQIEQQIDNLIAKAERKPQPR